MAGKIELVEVLDALRTELVRAVEHARGEQLQFVPADIKLELKVGVTHEVEGSAGLKFWVIELGTKGSYSTETVQTVALTLKPIIDGRTPTIAHERSAVGDLLDLDAVGEANGNP